jgi:RNA polymerase sigma-70 factor (ECF subfamily)
LHQIKDFHMSQPVTKSFVELIEQNRENDAYQVLYSQFHSVLLQFGTAYLKAKEPAEEIVNDVLYKVWSKKAAIVEICNLRVYLFTAVRNACLRQIAKTKKEQTIAANFCTPDIDAMNPESLLISTELHQLIKKTINDLPPRCKQIYEMIRLEGLRNKDVAQKLNISVNTIDVQLAIALKRLVQTLNAYNQKRASCNK